MVADLHRRAFPSREVALGIYASDRVHHYLGALIAFPSLQPDHLIVGAWSGQELVGYAHCRQVKDAWHLNNIAVSPEQRGRGIGRALIQRWMSMAADRGCSRLSLDVNVDNRTALEWYHSLGFEVASTRYLYACSKTARDAGNAQRLDHHARLVRWDNALAWQTQYGFSSFGIELDGIEWHVDRLPRGFFRVSMAFPLAGELALADLDPQRKLVRVSCSPHEGYEAVMVTHTMTKPCGRTCHAEGCY
jgi:ribosomal protein S18 acetylase RimI-like enzyme